MERTWEHAKEVRMNVKVLCSVNYICLCERMCLLCVLAGMDRKSKIRKWEKQMKRLLRVAA